MSEAPAPAPTSLWDGPTRLFHWTLVVLIFTAWFSAEKNMELHRLAGYGVLSLIVFRLWWGVAGGSTARFASFVKGPRTTLAYLSGLGSRKSGETAGHNPLGAWSVVAMLALIALQAGLGLFATDIDGIESGPLSDRVDFDTGRLFSEWHELAFRALQVLIGLHLAAIAFYAIWKRENLVRPMITGQRRFSVAVTSLRKAPIWSLLVGVVLAAAAAYAIAKGFRIKF